MKGRCVVFAAAMLATPAIAQAAGDADAAKGIVVEHCVSCHKAPNYPNPNRSEAAGAPDFQAVADDRATYTDARLRDFMRKPHFPMGSLILSSSDIDNLIAYLSSLRDR